MKPNKILRKLGPWGLVVVAGLLIAWLTGLQPKVTGGRQQALPAAAATPDADRELADMRATALVPLLQQLQQRNAGVFELNTGDTAGKSLTLRITNGEAAKGLLWGGRVPTAAQERLYSKNGIRVSAGAVQLPLERDNGVLLVRVPALMAFAIAR